jgi:hypothetical protein
VRAAARGKTKAKHSELIAALDGRFGEHHAELARMLLSQIDGLSTQIDTLSARIEELIAKLPDDTQAIDYPDSDPGAGRDADIDPDPNSSTGGRMRSGSILPLRPNARWAPSSGSTKSRVSACTTHKTSWLRPAWT